MEDILEECKRNALPLSAGVAVHVGPECSIQNFLEHAAIALKEACSHKEVSLSIYKKPNASLEAKRTLVQGHEKRFLFGTQDEV